MKLDDIEEEARRVKDARRLNKEKLKKQTLKEWRSQLNAENIRKCIVEAKSYNNTSCILVRSEKKMSEPEYETLLFETKIDGRTIEQIILDLLEPSHFIVIGEMIGIEHYGNLFEGYSFKETHFQIRLYWGVCYCCCTIQ